MCRYGVPVLYDTLGHVVQRQNELGCGQAIPRVRQSRHIVGVVANRAINFVAVDFVGLAASCVPQAASLLRQPGLMLRCLTFVAPSEPGSR